MSLQNMKTSSTSPHFGFTLAAYEVLKCAIFFPGGAKSQTGGGTLEVMATPKDKVGTNPFARSRNSLRITVLARDREEIWEHDNHESDPLRAVRADLRTHSSTVRFILLRIPYDDGTTDVDIT